MGKAAYSQPDGDAFGLSALRLDAGKRPPARGHRRLPAVDAGQLRFTTIVRTSNVVIPGLNFTHCHSGAARGAEPGISRFRARARARPGMTKAPPSVNSGDSGDIFRG